MKLARRRFLHLAGGAAALAAFPRVVRAQTYPTRPVRLVVGFAAGGGTDIVARLIGEQLSAKLGQSFVVENRTGAASNIATETVVNALPDGYTLLLATVANAANATLYGNLSFNFIRDVAPVAACVRLTNVLAVNASVPAKSVAEFIAYAKANPNKLNMGSGGAGGPVHMTGELFKMEAGIKMVHVPYRGEALALADLLGNQVQVVFPSLAASIGYARAGQVRLLGVTAATRSQIVPEIPTIAETIPGYESSTWYGVAAPTNTPPAVVERLSNAVNAALADPAFQAKIADLGGRTVPGSPSISKS